MKPSEVAEKYLGIPYKNRGRDLAGLDCYGLVLSIYADKGIALYDTEDEYAATVKARRKNYFIENYHRQWKEVPAPEFMDLVCFNNKDGAAYHIGVCLGKDRFIHTVRAGTVIGRISGWKKKIRGFYRLK